MYRIAYVVISVMVILSIAGVMTILLSASGGDSFYSLWRIGGDVLSWLSVDNGSVNSDLYIGTGVTTAPTVTTNDATAILTTSATLNGNLNSKGSAANVTVNFEWGTTSGVYTGSNPGVVVAVTGVYSYVVPPGTFVAGTPYYYRAKAVGDGTAYGSEKSFTTAAPLGVTTDGTSYISTDDVIVGGTVTGISSNPTVAAFFQMGLSTGVYNYQSAAQWLAAPGSFDQGRLGLTPSTLYFYRAVVVGAVGGTVYGSEENFTTLAAAVMDPPVMTVNTLYTYGALLDMAIPSGTWGYEVRYSLTTYPTALDEGISCGTWGTSTFNFLPVTPSGDKSNTDYYLSAWGYDPANGWGGTHTELLLRTLPNAPLTLVASAVGTATINLSWDTGYTTPINTMVRARTDVYPTSPTDPLSRGVYYGTDEVYSDTLLDSGTPYYYSAWLFNGAYGAVAWATATTPENPECSTLAATGASVTTAKLNGYVDSDGGNLCWARFQYGISPDLTDNTAWVNGYSTDDMPYVNLTGLTIDTTYSFRLQVYNVTTGIGSPVSGDTLTFSTCSALTHPAYLNAVAVSSTAISLSWPMGGCSDTSIVRYSSVGYPTTYNSPDGLEAYKGGATSKDLGSLLPGTTYYFRIWGTESTYTFYSASYSEAITTTTAGGGSSLPYDFPGTSNWFLDPDCSGLVDLPGYSIIENAAVGIGWTVCTGFVFLLFLLTIVVGMMVLYASKGNMIAVLVAMGLILLLGVIMGPIPKVWFIIYLTFSVPAGYLLPKGAGV